MKKRGATTGTAIALLIVGLLIGAGAIYALAPSLGLGGTTGTVTTTATVGGTGATTVTIATGGTVTTTAAGVTSTVTSTVSTGGTGVGLSGTIKIGYLTDYTSDLKSQGLRENFSSQMAINDINAMLTSTGSSVRFQRVVADYALDTTKALAALNAFKAQGITVVVGPLNSGTASGILQVADSNQIVLISPSSTAPQLAIPNDYLFRTAPNDGNQGHADAREMYQSGVKAIIIVYRQDTYGTGLSNATGAYFKKFGGTVVDSISYDATAADKGALDFSPILQKMSSDWTSASATYGANHTAFFLVTFEEMVKLLAQAKANFPSLLSTPQPWYQMDGTAQDSVVIGNSTSGPLMAQIRSPATLYAPFNSTKLVAFCHAFSMGFHNEPCDAYAQGGYDDTWLAALSILAAGVNSGAAIQANMLTVANNFYGVTGWNALQPSGDRSPINGYDIWKVVLVGSTPTWVLAGHWDPVADAVTWTSKP